LKALYYEKYGDISVLKQGELDDPKVVPDEEVLIKVKYFGLNPLDYKLRSGMLKLMTFPTFPRTTGSDFSGEIIALGKNVKNFKVGDNVFGFLSQLNKGVSSQLLTANESILSLIPSNTDLPEASAVPLAALTSYQALVQLAKVRKGNKVLINGASGGTGIFAVQIAKMLGSSVTSITSDRNIRWMRDTFLVDNAIDYNQENFLDNLKNNEYDIIYDCYGNLSFNSVKNLLKSGGSFVTTDPFKLSNLIGMLVSKFSKKNFLSVIVNSNNTDLNVIKNWIEDGKIKIFVDKKYNFNEAHLAYKYLETQRVKGKVIVKVDD
jgi:NADPH:quinone reductase-like Zn-dependent oxidoreductase